MNVQCLRKRRKLTRQSPSSKTKVKSADEERKNWSEFFFLDCEDRGLEFWELVGSGTSAESVSKKTKQPSSKTKAEPADEERKNWSKNFFFLDCEDRV